MKLVRFGDKGAERPGLLDARGCVRDLSAHTPDHGGEGLTTATFQRLAALDVDALPIVPAEVRLGVPVGGISKVIAVGLNYRDHAAETGMELPSEPLLFPKAVSAVSGPHDPVVLPRASTKGDWEVELAIVLGRRGAYIPVDQALAFVAGYTICNDVSERALQLERNGQWIKGKSNDTFCPLGPWLVTQDEVSDPQQLDLWLSVNDEVMQSSNTNQMVFGVAALVSYVSEFMTLHPGDVIITGTPPGVGMGRNPQRFLKPGDVMRLGVQGLGEQRQVCQAWAER